MRALPETVIEGRSPKGALVFSEKLGPALGWALVSVAGRVVAATEGGLFSFSRQGGARAAAEAIGVRALAVRGENLVLGRFGRDGTVADLDPETLVLTPRATLGAPIHALATPSASELAVSDNVGRITMLGSGAPRVLAKRAHAMVSIAALEDGSIAAASLGKTIYVFDPEGGKRVWEGLGSIPYRLAAHRDTIAAGVGKRVWIARAHQPATPQLHSAHEGIVSALTFDAEGTLWTAGEEGWIHAWPRHARGYGPKPSASIAGRGAIRALCVTSEAIFVLRGEP